MRDQKHDDALDRPYGPPTMLAAFDAVLLAECERSRNTRAATSKLTLCLVRLLAALASSHVNRSGIGERQT